MLPPQKHMEVYMKVKALTFTEILDRIDKMTILDKEGNEVLKITKDNYVLQSGYSVRFDYKSR